MGSAKKIRAASFAVFLFLFAAKALFPAPGNAKIGISALLDWEKGELEAVTDLDLRSAGIRFPTGRGQAEEILKEAYLGLVRPLLLSLQADSSSKVEDLILRGDFDLKTLDSVCLGANVVPPAFSADQTRFTGRYTVVLNRLSAALVRHRQAGDISRPFLPSPSADYTGIIIIADASLPIHGRNSSAMVRPCLFPKIWDTDMNLIYERNLTDPVLTGSGEKPVVRYAGPESIFRPTPSGLEQDLVNAVGERPLRIIARSVYGLYPTDPVIHRDDARLILSSENNRRLLREGKVVMVIDESMLRETVSPNP